MVIFSYSIPLMSQYIAQMTLTKLESVTSKLMDNSCTTRLKDLGHHELLIISFELFYCVIKILCEIIIL